MQNLAFFSIFVFVALAQSYPFTGEEPREYPSPGAHQLASWLTAQLRVKDLPIQELPIPPYRLPIQGKRNSELSNAILGAEETQKLYRDGRK